MTFKELNENFDKPFERIKHMSNRQIILCSLGMFLVLILATCIVYPLTNGMPLLGVPSEKNIVEVQVTDTRKSDETIVTNDENLIYFAKNVTGYLNYSFQKVEFVPEELFITIKYVEKDGTVTELLASENYIYWNGKYRMLMQPGVFSAWVEGAFFDGTVIVTKD